MTAKLSYFDRTTITHQPPPNETHEFNGTDDFVDLGRWDVAGDQITIEGWIYPRSFPGTHRDGRILSKAVGTGEQDHYWMLSTIAAGSETRLRFRLKTNGQTSTLVAHTGNVAVNRWQHVAAVYNGTHMILYLDGSEVGRLAKSGQITTNPDAPVWLGNNPVTRAQAFDGMMAWKRTTSP